MTDSVKQLARFSLRSIDKAIFRGGFLENDTIVALGSPRSGTTWIMEILNHLPEYTTVFEPFHPERFPRAGELKLSMRHYEAEGTENESLREYLGSIFRGEVSSQRPRYRLTLGNFMKRVTATKLKVKFVRANRLVPWILTNHNIRALVYIIRHPCATLASQLRTGYTGYDIYRLAPPIDELINDANKIGFEDTIINRLRGITTEIQTLAAVWAMDQVIPLRHNDPRMFKLSYEALSSNSEKEVMKVLRFLDETDRYEDIIQEIKRPSILSKRKSSDDVMKKTSWKNELNTQQIDNIRLVLNWFDVSFDDRSYTILDNTFPIEC